ncbi:MAG: polyphosphate polymerase domain-containing protein [Clostridiales bacterium]|nr:polyphosphate polymerase domain-containing protein [Clostridiales bacterium]
MEKKYRHELKYEINYSEYIVLRNRLKNIMKQDSHVNSEGNYLIRSIYFDNYKNKALKEKIDGKKLREKFRIRYYNNNLNYIVLEKKTKVNNLCKKFSAKLTEEECKKILDGDYEWMLKAGDELIKEFYIKLKNEVLRPSVLVSYTREPYVYSAGNVRVTFDFNIRSSMYSQDFLNKDIIDIDVSEANIVIMEVKYDEFLPDIIFDIIQNNNCRQEAFSKYCVSKLINN